MRSDRHGLAALGWHPDSAESQFCGIIWLMILPFLAGVLMGGVIWIVLLAVL